MEGCSSKRKAAEGTRTRPLVLVAEAVEDSCEALEWPEDEQTSPQSLTS